MKTQLTTKCLLSMILGVLVLGGPGRAGQFFFDDFSDGDPADGSPVNWVPASGGVYGAGYELTPEGLQVSGAGAADADGTAYIYRDVSVRAQISRASDHTNSDLVSGLAVRWNDGGPGGYWVEVRSPNRFWIGHRDRWRLMSAVLPFNVDEQEFVIRVDAVGNQIKCWCWPVGESMPESPQITLVDDVVPDGQVGLYAGSDGGHSIFRWVEVTVGTGETEPVSAPQEADDYVPFKVTGEGIYEHYEDPLWGEDLYPSDEQVGLFSISINPDKKSPQAHIHVDGVTLREVWGRPLLIEGDWVACFPQEPYRPEDVKPGQIFMFHTHHPIHGDVQIGVFAHDNCTPGYNTSEDPVWSDWFALVIEPLGGDGLPGTEDDLFTSMGIVTSGNVMDHRLEENDYRPFKVTGEGIYEHYEDPLWGEDLYPSDEEVGLFSLSINPDEKSPQAVIRVDGVKLREVWGRPLLIQDDWVACFPQEPYRPEDVKPGQLFMFYTHHPIHGDVQIGVFAHDNCTPGYNTSEDPVWSDWFVLLIEPLGGDVTPGNEDDLFTSMGIVTSGNVMDHRQ